jgi:VCBS repeat-containing protein|tara:strand:- start:505 stop:1113 length:609 start_codon:yes stop_codon:yes gene_type:complete
MSGSDVQATFIAPAVADPNGISTVATLAEAGNLTINGALADGGSVTFDQPRNVTILSASNDTGDTFTVTGTDETGAAQTEAITGANNDTAVGTKYFSTVTQIACSGATGGNVSAGSGTAIAAPVFRGSLRLRGLYVVNTASAGTIAFHEGSSSGRVTLKFNTVADANTTSYPDIPDSGIRCVSGSYVVYTQTNFSSMTVFYA